MLTFLLKKPTQFDTPFFRWMKANRPDLRFLVLYWQEVTTAADRDTETGASLTWGIDLLEGYPWQQVNPADQAHFAALLKDNSITYLVCNGWKNGFKPFIQTTQAANIPLGLRIDAVLWGKPTVEVMIRSLVLKKLYKPFQHFFSSGTVCDEYMQALGIPKDSWRRWPYCTDADFFRRNEKKMLEANDLKKQYSLSGGRVLLGICKWVARENPMELLKAFIAMNDPSLQLVMIGDGPLRKKLEEGRRAYPNLKIVFPGYVPYNQLPSWYAMTDVFIHPAGYEPWGVSIQEAMISGCAVIASTRVGSGYDLIQQGKNGFQYPAGKPSVLAETIKAALQLPPESVKETNQKILQNWQYDTVARQFENLTIPVL